MMSESTYLIEKLWRLRTEEQERRAARRWGLAQVRRWASLGQMSSDQEARLSRDAGGKV